MYWTAIGSAAPIRIHYGSAVVGKNIYTFGGRARGMSFINYNKIEIRVMDTETLKWSKLEVPQEEHTKQFIPTEMCLLLDLNMDYESDEYVIQHNISYQCYYHIAIADGSKVYLWGGVDKKNIFNCVHCFDTETLKWSTPILNGYIPTARLEHSTCKIQNCIYIYGGLHRYPYFPSHALDVLMFNLQTMTWSLIEAQGIQPYPRHCHSAAAIGNRMYIFGGRRSIENEHESLYLDDIHYFDTTTRNWVTPVVNGYKPVARCDSSAFAHRGYLYIFGGFNGDFKLHFQDINRYDPENSTWTLITPIGISPCARRTSICKVIDDRVFICGGTSIDNYNQTFSTPEEYILSHIFNDCKQHNDVYVLDLNPSLTDICLLNAWEYIKKKKIQIDDLCIPLSLKKELSKLENFKATNVE